MAVTAKMENCALGPGNQACNLENDMETEEERPVPEYRLLKFVLKLLFVGGLLLVVMAGLCLWWLSSLSDVPPRP